ncbi:unnamed protein product [Prorocentrum cordatum]|uniref:PDZ domain-containing protein n=1 Tax=Prorocentrum cordatum TaxID=2364126 RepID=A0ABN9UN46_9DINO|nr:unnamed protein product [Polarella glacialis]
MADPRAAAAAPTSASQAPGTAATPRAADDLAEVLRQRRAACAEAEPEATETSTAAVAEAAEASAAEAAGARGGPAAVEAGAAEGSPRGAAAPAARAAPGRSAVARSDEDLAQVLRHRREVCTELESVPGGSTADSGAAFQGAGQSSSVAMWESVPGGSTADTGSRLQGAEQRADCTVWQSVPSGSKADATASSAPVAAATAAARGPKTQAELQSWMETRRDRCKVIESDPVAPGAGEGAVTADPAVTAAAMPSVAVASASVAAPERLAGDGSRARASGDDLARWMERMRGRCEVIESFPEAHVSDALWDGPLDGECSAAENFQDLRSSLEARASQARPPEARPSQPGRDRARRDDWARCLGRHEGAEGEFADVPAVLPRLLAGRSVVDALPADATPESLSVAFAEKYLVWRSEDTSGRVFGILAQLLRYHFPSRASALQSLPGACESLADTLSAACGGAGGTGLARLLLEPCGETSHTLLLCDMIVSEQKDLLPLFVVLALLGDLPDGPAGEALPQLAARLPRAVQRSLGEGTRRGVERARELYEATPRSFCMCVGSSAAAAAPICSVEARELVEHVYDPPELPWRLVAVDLRGGCGGVVLPVCLRLGAHQDIGAVLEDMPDEDCIHLCLVADGDPGALQEALELGKQLTGTPLWRRHISVASGGWHALTDAVHAGGFDLVQVEGESCVAEQEKLGAKKGGLMKVAGSWRHKVAKSSEKVAHSVFKGASKALQKISEQDEKIQKAVREGLAGLAKGEQEPCASPALKDLDFAEGPLGFDLRGTVVSLVEPESQAALLGVGIGDVLVAVAGREIPSPPPSDSAEEGENRVKRLIKRWIKEKPRPVRLSFKSGGAGAEDEG